jgi:hypothetical protein
LHFGCATSSASAQVDLSTCADAEGFLNVQALFKSMRQRMGIQVKSALCVRRASGFARHRSRIVTCSIDAA